MNKNSKDYLDLMKGCEVWSLNYEGCVYINGLTAEVIMNGEVVDTLDTDTKVKKLWKEYVKGEGF